MISAIFLTQIIAAQPVGSDVSAGYAPWFFSAPGSSDQEFLVQIPSAKRASPRISPKNQWKFNWIFPGYAKVPSRPEVHTLRFRTYLQTREERDLGPLVTRLLLQLYGFNLRKLRLEHGSSYFRQLVDVYLCDGGKAGGEQLSGEDPYNKDEYGRPQRTNQIYIYDLKSFTSSVEMVREIAHEYGHATLPPVGSYKTPEYWANGHLGEVLYLTWLNRELKSAKLQLIDAMGATSEQLGKYVQANIAPLASRSAASGPVKATLDRKDKVGMDHWLGLILHMESVMPEQAFRRSLILSSQVPADYMRSAVAAIEEAATQTFIVPRTQIGKKFWIPLGKGKLVGLKPLQSRNGWAQVQPKTSTFRATFPQS